VPISISAEQRALAASIREWAIRAGTLALVRGGPAGDAVYAFLLSRCLSIAGGTSQILLSVVAERALGLPREQAR
jgi:alkylation response protein AidB-like acyl-CoA dehydrogenase